MLLLFLIVLIVVFRGFLKIDAKQADNENIFPNQPININKMQATENTGALADPKEQSAELVSGDAAVAENKSASEETKPEENKQEETAQAAETAE